MKIRLGATVCPKIFENVENAFVIILEAISKIVFGVFFSGEAAEKHTNPLVFEMTSNKD
jgi:uncharacterized protein (UPF0212 family)